MASVSEQVDRPAVLALCTRQREKCQRLVSEAEGSPHIESVRKALISAELSVALLQMSGVDKTKALHQALQKYIQSILDSTHYQESCLVDKDFPEGTLIEDVQGILDQFSDSVNVCSSSYSQLIGILGEEVVECIHWRIGALLYMVAHTIMNSDNRRETANRNWLTECCRVGVIHLKKIFEVRSLLTDEDDYTTNDDRLPRLLKHGIRSDTHMLALAYGGEMCYWFRLNQISSSSTDEKESTAVNKYPELYKVMEAMHCSADVPREDTISVGIKFLTQYIEVARSSISMQSWHCERPEEVLKELKEMMKQ